jgi:hypothetical protein
MSRSLFRATLTVAAVLITTLVVVGNAGASRSGLLTRTCSPAFTTTQTTYAVTIAGTCFPAATKARVKFAVTSATTPTETLVVSSTGSFSDPAQNCLGSLHTIRVTVRDLKTGWSQTKRVKVPACKLP